MIKRNKQKQQIKTINPVMPELTGNKDKLFIFIQHSLVHPYLFETKHSGSVWRFHICQKFGQERDLKVFPLVAIIVVLYCVFLLEGNHSCLE